MNTLSTHNQLEFVPPHPVTQETGLPGEKHSEILRKLKTNSKFLPMESLNPIASLKGLEVLQSVTPTAASREVLKIKMGFQQYATFAKNPKKGPSDLEAALK